MKILKETKEPLLSRKKLILEITHEKSSTPNLENTKKQLTDLLKANPELLIIKNIYSRFGDAKADILAYLYDNIEAYKKFEIIKKKVKKEKPKEEEKQSEKK